jgi:ABC-type phosphate transport system substrate-binding protein
VKRAAKLGVAGFGAVVLSAAVLVPSVSAYADYAPGPNDVVGVGGDTPMFDLAFGADGDTSGDPGYNSAGNVYKLVTFGATPDGNARAAYANGSTESSPIPLNATDVLRAGTSPVQRVQSSGAAITALLADTGSPEVINFVFSASEPTAAQQAQASTNGWGFLHVVELGSDAVKIVADTTTNAPAGLSIAELLSIYKGTVTKWNQLPGNSGGSGDTIIPLLPPSSSSITKTFLADLKSANGGTAPTLANPNIATVEQNDPTAITGIGASADAIVPFSSARLALYQSGYFHNPATTFPGGAAINPGVSALTATAPDSSAAYTSPVNHYVIFRQSDAGSATAWQPGGTKNWVQTLFSGTRPFFDTGAGLADIAAGGTTPAYNDLGDVSSG